ncbi:MAG: hypothetical protein ACR2QU_04370 [Gammaproteobacteria bacterium]
MSFWDELKSRSVVRVGIAYLAVVWLLLQVADTVLPNFGSPSWVMQVLIVGSALGFPVALVLAWFYELTPDGILAASQSKSAETVPFAGRKIDFVIIGVLVLAVGFLLVRPLGDEPAGTLSNSVAVLPFENLSPDSKNAYFAAGIHEEILNQLSKVSALNVIARTSVMQYSSGEKAIPEIARELNVETVMEGSVRYADGRVLVTAQLIDPQTNVRIWSESYNRDFADIFSIQSDIATNVVDAVGVTFSLAEQERIDAPATNSPAAYALLLQARDLSETGGNDSAPVYALLDRAIQLDPDFAQAYAYAAFLDARSLVNTVYALAIDAPERASLERSLRANVKKALSLDPSSEQANNALAGVEIFNWRWTAAHRSFETAGSLAWDYTWLLALLGQRDESLAIARRQIALDPAPVRIGNFGIALGYLGEYEASREQLLIATELQPLSPLWQSWLAFVHTALGDQTAALEQLEYTEKIMGENRLRVLLPELAHAYAVIGRTEDAHRIFQEIRELGRDEELGAGTWAQAYLAIGDQQSALMWLETAVEKAQNHEPDAGFFNLMFIKMNVLSDAVLEEPEFVALRNRLTGS